jgi:uncharacterized protein YbjT (DUF2867 family)
MNIEINSVMKYTHAILGGTGHIGAALSTALLQKQQKVMIIGHDPAKAAEWIVKGAAYEVADIRDTARLKELFGQAERLFVLNPNAAPDKDIDAVEREQIGSILNALEGSELKKIVAASTYGAQPGDHIFDLGALYELEQGLAKLDIPLAVIRSAYYMSNFDQAIPAVREKGELTTLFPADFKLPMVAPADIGAFAAKLMLDDRTGLFFLEGPETYSNQDVAETFGKLLHKTVNVVTIPEAGWKDFLIKGGFSEKAAASFANMTRLTISQQSEIPTAQHGPTTLFHYLEKQLQVNGA